MAGYDIATLALTVDSQGFVSGVDQASSALGRFQQQSVLGTGTAGRLDSAVQGLWVRMKQLAAVAGASWGFLKLAGMTKEVVMLSARFSTLGVVMERVRQNIGKTAEEMEALELGLRKTGISMIESRQQLIAMTQANLDLANASKLARVAQDAAVVGNTNSSNAFARLIHGLRTGQTDVLRMLGLQVNFQEAEKKLADQLNKTVGALTLKEKQQARVNAVMDQAKSIQGSYEAAMTDAGKILQSTVRYVEDLKVIIGEVFKPQFTAFVKAYAKALQDSQEWVQANTDKLIMMKDMLVAVAKAIGLVLYAWVMVKAAMVFFGIINGLRAMAFTLKLVEGGLLTTTKAAVIFKTVMTAITAHPIVAVTTAVLGLAAAFFMLRKRKKESEIADLKGLQAPSGITNEQAERFKEIEREAQAANKAMIEAREEFERLQRLRQRPTGYNLLGNTATTARGDKAKPGEEQAYAAVKMFNEQKITIQVLLPILADLSKRYGTVNGSLMDLYTNAQKMNGAFAYQAQLTAEAAAQAQAETDAANELAAAEARAAAERLAALRDTEREFKRNGEQQAALRSALSESVSAYQELTKVQLDDNAARSAAAPLWEAWERVQVGAEGRVRSLAEALEQGVPKAREYYNMALLQAQGARGLEEAVNSAVEAQERMLKAEQDMDAEMAGGQARIDALTREVNALREGRSAYENFLQTEQRRQFIEKAGAGVAAEYRMEREKQAAAEYDLMRARDHALQKLQKQVAAEQAYKEREKQKREDAEERARQEIQKGNELYVNALRGLQEAFAQTFQKIFDNGINSFKDFADSVVQIFKQMIAQIAAAMLVKEFGLDTLMKKVLGGTKTGDKGGLGVLLKQPWSYKGAAVAGATGALAGYTSGSPIAGALTGAGAGLMMAGPMGAVVGGVAGIVGGLFGLGKKAAEARRLFTEALKQWDEAFDRFGQVGRLARSDLESSMDSLEAEFEKMGRDLMKTFKVAMEGHEFESGDAEYMAKGMAALERAGILRKGGAERMLELLDKYRKAEQELFVVKAQEAAMAAGSLRVQRMRLEQDERGAAELELSLSLQERELALKQKYGQVLPPAIAMEWERIKLLEQEALARKLTVDAMQKQAEQNDQMLGLSERELGVRLRQATTDEARIRIEKELADLAAQRSYSAELAAAEAAVAAGEMTVEMFARLAAVLGDELTLALADSAKAAADAAKALVWQRYATAQSTEARIAELTGDTTGAEVIRRNLEIAEEIRNAEALRDAGFITAEAFDRLRAALLASALTAEQMQAALIEQAAGSVAEIRAKIEEMKGNTDGADLIRRTAAVANEIKTAQELVEVGALTQEMFEEFRDLLLESLLPLEEVTDALGFFGDAATSTMQNLQSLADRALGLIGATTEQQGQYALSLLKLNPAFDQLIGSAASFADAGSMIQQWLASNFPDASGLAGMTEEDRTWWSNLMTQASPLVSLANRYREEQAALLEQQTVQQTEQKKTSLYTEESVGVLLRLDALQATANVYLREIRDGVAGGALGFTFGGNMSMNINVTVNGVDEAYGTAAGNQIGGQVAAVLDRKLSARATFSRSSKGAYKPL